MLKAAIAHMNWLSKEKSPIHQVKKNSKKLNEVNKKPHKATKNGQIDHKK